VKYVIAYIVDREYCNKQKQAQVNLRHDEVEYVLIQGVRGGLDFYKIYSSLMNE